MGDSELPFALSKVNHAAAARFVIIIDEWDAIFRETAGDKDGQQAYIRLLRGLFKGEQSKDFYHACLYDGHPAGQEIRLPFGPEYVHRVFHDRSRKSG